MSKIKIYFIENSIAFDANDLDKITIGGAEKTLINISNELAKNDKFDIKVFNLTNNNQKICKIINGEGSGILKNEVTRILDRSTIINKYYENSNVI